MPVNFDDYKDDYREQIQKSISFVGQDAEFFTELRCQWLLSLARRHLGDLKGCKLLDVGCGLGLSHHYLSAHFAETHGVDLAEGVIQKAREKNPDCNYCVYNGKALPFPDHSFDLVVAMGVLHHVPPEERESLVSEMVRVVKVGGIVVVFEHNPFNPLTRLAVTRCEFDAGAVLLTQGATKGLLKGQGLAPGGQGYVIFFPFRGKWFRFLERKLKWLPLGAQYYVVGKKQ